jgi:integrase/recombinase XerD
MYRLYRRHESSCRFRNNGVRMIQCKCPVWMDGADELGKRQRYSLKTRSWSHAQARLVELENGITPLPVPLPTERTIDSAVASYLEDCRTRKLADNTVTSYTKTLDHLMAFLPGKPLNAVDLDTLTKFRSSRAAVTANTATKEIFTLRTFFEFCRKRKWVTENPASDLKPPKADMLPTMPFTADEITAILEACNRIEDNQGLEVSRTRTRARALILTLLYSGFRISDAIKLERSAIDMRTGRLLIRMMKTREPLYIRLPQIVVDALAALPVESKYFFWSGKSKLSCSVGNARRTVERILARADVSDGHPHRFRDTFSVELLTKGVDLHKVQRLLGHTSIRTTEKHYAPFVVAMQQGLDEAVSVLSFGARSTLSADKVTRGDAAIVSGEVRRAHKSSERAAQARQSSRRGDQAKNKAKG